MDPQRDIFVWAQTSAHTGQHFDSDLTPYDLTLVLLADLVLT